MAGMGVICLDITGGPLANLFTLQMEAQGARIGKNFHQGISDFLAGLETLRGVVTTGILRNSPEALEEFDKGVELLNRSAQSVSKIVDSTVLARRFLLEHEDKNDLLIKREAIFPSLDYGAYYERLFREGAIPNDKLLWDDMVGRMQKGAAKEGLKLLEEAFGRLSGKVCTFVDEVNSSRDMPILELSDKLHHMAIPVASLLAEWMKTLSYCIYFTLIAEEGATVLKKKEGI